MKFTKYNLAIIIGVLVVVAVALFDIQSANSGVFGSVEKYTSGDYTDGWWDLFKVLVLFSFAIVPICYFVFYKRDKSEAVGIFLTSYLMWMFGLADILYFWLQGKAIPETLPWLVAHPVFSTISSILKYNEVTPFVLYVSVALGGIIVYYSTKFMRRLN